ncbi:hypothetical protein [Aidingimonas halophila]|uniref:Holin n=1 Tax=Aidingimonas halophila TaxID=574349 RepID=A0A1H2RGW4_9GAMM|nr:hypothetical protein [Aidingimonas halophila]GHC19362.1 hypothetical protein GCM10008094_06700 [Aidingimonas halophila]SDW17889.1 hypothetical protein SAMN05443545_101303 [Aidingimonas halophila]
MKLIPESGKASRMWSIRLAALSAGLAAAEASLPLWEGVVSDGLFAALSSAVAIAAAIARVIKQDALHDG